MDSIKKKNATSASRIGGGSGGSNNKAAGSGNEKNKNIFADALGKIDLFNNKPNNKTANSRGGGQSLGGSKPGRVFSVSLDQPGSLGMEVCG